MRVSMEETLHGLVEGRTLRGGPGRKDTGGVSGVMSEKGESERRWLEERWLLRVSLEGRTGRG